VFRIGLDARMAGSVPSGLGTYAANLARALPPLDRSNRYVIIRGPASPSLNAADDNVEDAVLPGELDTPRNLLHGRAISHLRLDLYHSLHHFLPLALRVPRVVVTLHDLIWIEHASLSRSDRAGAIANHLFARATMGRALRRADRIIAVSEHTRARALDYYGLDSSRIQVVYHGVDHDLLQTATQSPSRMSAPYFLCLGNTRPYKNIPTALRAFASCARRRSDIRLIVVGRGDSFGALRTLARRLGVDDRVQFIGPVNRGEVARLLQGAVALVFPSLVEGFGFPVLEAMAAGCPVIASRCPTLVEVAGSAAVFCEATDVDQFAAAMTSLLDDDSRGGDLRRRGRERASQFTWQRCASETLALYRQLLR
jgi:glycosyltransferase involved in cell wall biosynthesis